MEDAAVFTMLLEIRPPWRVTRVEVGERRVRLAFLLFDPNILSLQDFQREDEVFADQGKIV